MSKRARGTLWCWKEEIFFSWNRAQGFVSLRKSGTSWTMPLHTETSLRQLYSHARSHINRFCLRLPRLLTISRFSALRLDGTASVLNRSGMIPFAVFYLSSVFSYSRQDDLRPRYYCYQYVKIFVFEFCGWFDPRSLKTKSKDSNKESNRFYNLVLFRCNHIYIYWWKFIINIKVIF